MKTFKILEVILLFIFLGCFLLLEEELKDRVGTTQESYETKN